MCVCGGGGKGGLKWLMGFPLIIGSPKEIHIYKQTITICKDSLPLHYSNVEIVDVLPWVPYIAFSVSITSSIVCILFNSFYLLL